jgi:hypothetical protein
MPVIRIRERNGIGKAESAEVSFDGEAGYPVTLEDPFSEADEKRLEWYFEEHLRRPFLDQIKAEQNKASIFHYGEKLFGQVFADRETYAHYKEAQGTGKLRFEITGSPNFHRLHWEALKDPTLPDAFVLHSPMVRRSLERPSAQAKMQSLPTLNILLVVARPRTKQDVSYRTISRPFVEGLRTANL